MRLFIGSLWGFQWIRADDGLRVQSWPPSQSKHDYELNQGNRISVIDYDSIKSHPDYRPPGATEA